MEVWRKKTWRRWHLRATSARPRSVSLEQPESEIALTVDDKDTPFLLTFEQLLLWQWQWQLKIYLYLSYQLKGGFERSVNVEVFLPKKAQSLPQLGLPGKEVESPTNPGEKQKLIGMSVQILGVVKFHPRFKL